MPLQYSALLQRKPPQGGGGDPHWANVVYLCGFDGVDGATDFDDESSYARVNSYIGSAQCDTANPILGTASLLLDGASDSVQCADADELSFGTADFTVEAVVDLDTLAVRQVVAAKYSSQSGAHREWVCEVTSATVMRFIWYTAGQTATVYDATMPAISTGVKYHLVWERDGNDLNFYVAELGSAGSLVGTVDVTGVDIPNLGGVFNIGAINTTLLELNGHVDEGRVTNGVPRYQGTLPALTGPFPRGAA